MELTKAQKKKFNDNIATYPNILYNLDVEKEVLCALMNGRSDNRLTEGMFFDDTHRIIFNAIKAIEANGCNADVLKVSEYLTASKQGCPSLNIKCAEINGMALKADYQFNANVWNIVQMYKRRTAHLMALKLTDAAMYSADIDEVLTDVAKEEAKLVGTSLDRFANWLRIPTPSEIRGSLGNQPLGIKTKYAFERSNGEMRQLIIPSAAITLICGQTSHGKSRFLQNLALDVATNGDEGTVLYFTFEEDKGAVQNELLNIYANMELSGNNLRTIESFYHDKFYLRSGVSVAEFQKKEQDFMELEQSGMFHIIEDDVDSTELISGIRCCLRQTKVKAVFIDYAQLLYNVTQNHVMQIGWLTTLIRR